jgi:hypothetical protein
VSSLVTEPHFIRAFGIAGVLNATYCGKIADLWVVFFAAESIQNHR